MEEIAKAVDSHDISVDECDTGVPELRHFLYKNDTCAQVMYTPLQAFLSMVLIAVGFSVYCANASPAVREQARAEATFLFVSAH